MKAEDYVYLLRGRHMPYDYLTRNLKFATTYLTEPDDNWRRLRILKSGDAYITGLWDELREWFETEGNGVWKLEREGVFVNSTFDDNQSPHRIDEISRSS
ncbi:hypothetical protein CHU98_g9575 [Xylaria longipes]|nr:hypothetical protein CHU98_g9575 [Xylaria longipes]